MQVIKTTFTNTDEYIAMFPASIQAMFAKTQVNDKEDCSLSRRNDQL